MREKHSFTRLPAPRARNNENVKTSRARLLQEENATSTNQEEMRPLQYYDELRESTFPHETRDGSAMYRVNDTSRNETIRLAHIASLNPYSEMLPDGTRLFIEFLAYMEASVFLGLHHFNERSADVLPHLPDLLQECNVHMTIDIIDTLLSPLVASRTFFDLSSRQTSLSQPPVLSIAGAARSATSQPLSILAGVYDVPIVNGVSTSSALDQTENYPTFVRTVPNNSLDSLAVVTYPSQSTSETLWGHFRKRPLWFRVCKGPSRYRKRVWNDCYISSIQ